MESRNKIHLRTLKSILADLKQAVHKYEADLNSKLPVSFKEESARGVESENEEELEEDEYEDDEDEDEFEDVGEFQDRLEFENGEWAGRLVQNGRHRVPESMFDDGSDIWTERDVVRMTFSRKEAVIRVVLSRKVMEHFGFEIGDYLTAKFQKNSLKFGVEKTDSKKGYMLSGSKNMKSYNGEGSVRFKTRRLDESVLKLLVEHTRPRQSLKAFPEPGRKDLVLDFNLNGKLF